ncbi:hypothetical protein L596_017111 [Steinernema carpocapsae]|nr:hypothetical protein L596_017111 [Steinernema carpocapsae]
MLYDLLGPAAFIGFGVLCLVIIPTSLCVSWQCQVLEGERMEIRDERVKMTNEILNGIKAIKFYAWEDSMKKIVKDLRKSEMGILKKLVTWIALLTSAFGCIPLIVTGTTFGSFILLDPEKNILTPKIAFMALTINDIIYGPIFSLANTMYCLINFLVSNRRLKSFMSENELERYVEYSPNAEHAISLQNASFSWEESSRMVLKNLSITVTQGELVAIVGEVGCGKSSLISALLGEMTKEAGRVHVSGSVAYVPQQAWIQNGTLKDNILFGAFLDGRLYKDVIEACALGPDLELLTAGDATEIGEKGINLSGGQKQRVSLARAVYSQRDVFLLDDPLSAVDAHVGKHLFDKVLSSETGILKGRTRILVTHGVNFLKFCDRVIVLKGGTISEQGSYKELLASEGAFAEYLKEYMTEKKATPAEDVEHALENLESPEKAVEKPMEVKDHHKPEKEEEDKDEEGKLIENETLAIGQFYRSFEIGLA